MCASLKLQAAYRGSRTRQLTHSLRRDLGQAATMLQKNVKGRLARRPTPSPTPAAPAVASPPLPEERPVAVLGLRVHNAENKKMFMVLRVRASSARPRSPSTRPARDVGGEAEGGAGDEYVPLLLRLEGGGAMELRCRCGPA